MKRKDTEKKQYRQKVQSGTTQNLQMSNKHVKIFSTYLVIEVAQSLSHVRLFVTPWTVAHQTPPSMEFSRQEYWSGLPFSSPGDLPNPGIELRSPTLQEDSLPAAGGFFTREAPKYWIG